MGGSREFKIPCFLSDLEGLEHFLEAKAGEGWALTGFSRTARYARFEEAERENVFYCAAVYPRALKKEELETQELLAYRRAAGEKGWEFVCLFKNLLIFSSRLEERPVSLRSGGKDERRSLMDITLRVDRNRALLSVLLALAWAGLFGGWKIGSLIRAGGVYLHAADGLVLAAAAAFCLSELVNYLVFARDIKKGKKAAGGCACLYGDLLTGAVITLACAALLAEALPAGDPVPVAAAAAGVLLGCAYLFYLARRQRRPRRKAGWADAGLLVLLLTVIAAYAFLPRMEMRRFQWSRADVVLNQTEKERGIQRLGLSYEDMGWEADEYALYYESPPYQCRREMVVYWEDFGSWKDGVRLQPGELRYIGTAMAELESESGLSDYLAARKLRLSDASGAELLEGVASYVFPDGKTLVNVRGTQVVVYFLSPGENRTFQMEDPAVTSALSAGLGEYFQYAAHEASGMTERMTENERSGF